MNFPGFAGSLAATLKLNLFIFSEQNNELEVILHEMRSLKFYVIRYDVDFRKEQLHSFGSENKTRCDVNTRVLRGSL